MPKHFAQLEVMEGERQAWHWGEGRRGLDGLRIGHRYQSRTGSMLMDMVGCR